MIRVKIKQSDESRASNTTMTDDGELTVALSASTTYFVDMLVIADSNATAAFKLSFVYTSTLTSVALTEMPFNAALPGTGGSGDGFGPAWHLTGSNLTTPTVRVRTGSGTANTTLGGHLRGVVVTNGAGNLKVQWAQNVSNPGNTTVHKGSYIVVATQTEVEGTLIVKAGDTSRTNNTLTADPDLTFSTGANKKYIVELLIVNDGNSTTPDYKDAWHDANVSITAGHTLNSHAQAAGVFSTGTETAQYGQWWNSSFVTTPTTGVMNTSTTANKNSRHVLAAHQMGGSAGTFAYEWAQNTTNATATILRAPSWLWYQEVEQA